MVPGHRSNSLLQSVDLNIAAEDQGGASAHHDLTFTQCTSPTLILPMTLNYLVRETEYSRAVVFKKFDHAHKVDLSSGCGMGVKTEAFSLHIKETRETNCTLWATDTEVSIGKEVF